ncbi:GntR family transcriptional regulator [Hyphococcus sp.]|uniref:GntR family transcriptional regulator n=1 Tax=Hyphococcus sp. TaxID=2038636 RepID=UPI0020869346|nr:MAG: GntR family transcriptional regulator [Marinicaulis sp.]
MTTPEKPKKAPRISAADIAQKLSEAILSQKYLPGDRIKEQDVADRFGVSRGPVREALKLLDARGLLRVEPGRGASVVSMSDDEALQAIEISGVLFGLSARRAAVHATKKEKKALRNGVKRLEKLASTDISPKEFFLETIELGSIVTEASHSPRLRALIRDIRAGAPTMFGPLGFLTQSVRERAAQNWRLISDAIHKEDGVHAEQVAIRLYDEASDAARSAQEIGLKFSSQTPAS